MLGSPNPAIRNADRYHAIALLLGNQCPTETYSDGSALFVFPLHCEGEVEVYAHKDNEEWVVVSAGLKEDSE